ncbi:c-type cytochrome [Ralstonia sp. 1B3]|uniref:c-type cytochrome n=1 Tax=Ralstonia sp. 1B3 TaxID=2997421 RepID=UPI002FCAAFC3
MVRPAGKGAAEDTARARILVTQGSGAVPPACATCHGAKSVAPQPFPALEGLPAEYIVKQLLDYRSGARQSSVMQPVARELSDSDITAVARYYAAQARPGTAALPTDGAAASLHWSGTTRVPCPPAQTATAPPDAAAARLATADGATQGHGRCAAQCVSLRRARQRRRWRHARFARRLTAAEIEGLDNFYAAASAPQGGVSKPAQ